MMVRKGDGGRLSGLTPTTSYTAVSSLSGSESESSTSTLSKPLSKALHLPADAPTTSKPPSTTSSDHLAELTHSRLRADLRTALIWLTPSASLLSALPPPHPCTPDTQFGIYRALLPSSLPEPAAYLPALRRIQLDPARPDGGEERRYTLLMSAGGHFAGMVVGLRPLDLTHGKGGKPERQTVKGAGEVRVIEHKTFHRYTTRKKQGGSQSTNDSGKGKANSAGAMLRRYGEQTLKEEIQALMIEWADSIHSSERIFLRASAAGRRAFWGYEGAVLEKGDERIRGFPFPTRRPTLSELLRCFRELMTVKISHLSEDALKALEDEYIASLQPRSKPAAPTPAPAPPPKPAAPKLTPEELALRDLRERYLEMLVKSRLEALKPFWAKHGPALGGVEGRMEEWVDEERFRGWTGLMVASAVAGAAGEGGKGEEVVGWFLEELRADPTATVGGGAKTSVVEDGAEDQAGVGEEGEVKRPGKSRTAYDLATTKPTRNVFRRLAHSHPDWWDWTGAGHVPSGLSEEQEAEQERRKGERRKGMREKAREREAKRAVEEPVIVPVVAPAPKKEEVRTGPQKLGGGRAGGEAAGLAGLSDEMRARVERERRARAAEARLGGGK